MRFNHNQKVLLWEAALWAVYNACTITYLVAFALELGASNTVIGLLSAIPFISLILAEFPASKLVELFSRRRITFLASLLSRLFWVLIFLFPILFKEPLFWIVFFYFISRSVGSLATPAFWSLVGDIVPQRFRGRFLSVRMRVLGFVGMVFAAVAGVFLKQFPNGDLTGFILLFVFGVLAGVGGSLQFLRLRNPRHHDHEHHSLKEFFTLNPLMRKFVFVVVFFNFAFMIASPLFAVYILKNLGMNYALYGFVIASATLTRILLAPHFGRIVDSFGSRNVAVLCIFGSAFVPFLFLFVTHSTRFWVFPIMILSGAAWVGVDLSILNLLLDFTDKDRRAMQIAEYQFYTSIPLVVAPIVGGIIADNVVVVLSGIPLVFAVSFVLRAIASLFVMFLPEKHTKKEYPLGMVFHEMVAPSLLRKRKR
ncbi:hypothetical protein DRJ22_03415 [Candidatus Woesearchaeota archaeon]|nr:MAG: hypothetical protein DRJ22_03415 [Candidatus Woesearchaeota archaeon]